ncbi:TetR/AcrR family transcriptional regulator [Tenacibaculum ascidiaceicola]|uniref:TetR/AcrR family transcriptional regulator n=1 Tax=Tenacibaculum ascidiaceicola TaxID=1699411 RepID=UPI0039EA98FA
MKVNKTKLDLIQTTSNILRLKGAESTGIMEIIKEVGCPKGSLYHHFPNGKKELVINALKFYGEEQTKKFSRILSNAKSLEEGVNGIIDLAINDLLNSDFQSGCGVTTTLMSMNKTDNPEIFTISKGIFENWKMGLLKFMKQFNPEVSMDEVDMFFTKLQGGTLLVKSFRDINYLEKLKTQE